jgi:transposase
MTKYAALDVSVKDSAVCIIDANGSIVRETKVASEVPVVTEALRAHRDELALVALEAGPLSQHLFDGLAEAGYPMVCCETRKAKKFLEAWDEKTDRSDAHGLAQMVRTGLHREVHVKTRASQEIRTLLNTRKTLQSQMLDLQNNIRGVLKNYGLKVGKVSEDGFTARVRELIGGEPALQEAIEPLLEARKTLRDQFKEVDRKLHRMAYQDEICRLFMTAQSIGALTALTFKAGVDQPQRFAKSKSVGAHFGLTPERHQSGEIDIVGNIDKRGDRSVRTGLYEAANVILNNTKKWSWLKSWAMQIAKRRGMERAKVALARRLAEVLHRMWCDGTTFQWQRAAA